MMIKTAGECRGGCSEATTTKEKRNKLGKKSVNRSGAARRWALTHLLLRECDCIPALLIRVVGAAGVDPRPQGHTFGQVARWPPEPLTHGGVGVHVFLLRHSQTPSEPVRPCQEVTAVTSVDSGILNNDAICPLWPCVCYIFGSLPTAPNGNPLVWKRNISPRCSHRRGKRKWAGLIMLLVTVTNNMMSPAPAPRAVDQHFVILASQSRDVVSLHFQLAPFFPLIGLGWLT